MAIDFTDSSTSTDVLDEVVVSINKPSSKKERKTHKDHISNKRSCPKQRKKLSFPQDQQNSSELLDNNISMTGILTEIPPIIETYEQKLETFQMSQTFGTLITGIRATNLSDSNQSLAQIVSHHNELQPMTTQQKAAMGHVALINFFGESGTVTSTMNTVQPSHTQTSTKQVNQSELNISKSHQGMSLPVSTHSCTIPHITHSTRTDTDTTINKIATDKVTEYHNITLILILILIEEE